MTDTARTDANRLAESIADRMVDAITVDPTLVDNLPVVVLALLAEYDRSRTRRMPDDWCSVAPSVADGQDPVDPVVWLTRWSGDVVDRLAERAG